MDGDRKYTDGDHQYWYNTRTGEVEYGMLVPAVDRIGPFETADAAARALQTLKERSEAWAVEEAIDDDWRRATGAGE